MSGDFQFQIHGISRGQQGVIEAYGHAMTNGSPEARRIEELLNGSDHTSGQPSSVSPIPPKTDLSCAVATVGMLVSGPATVIGGATWYVSWKNGRATEFTPFMTGMSGGLFLWQWSDYMRFCKGPSGPQGPGQLDLKQNQPSDLPRDNPDVPLSWEKIGWGVIGGLAAIGAAALVLVPFDGPAGEYALGAASLAAFTKAGLSS